MKSHEAKKHTRGIAVERNVAVLALLGTLTLTGCGGGGGGGGGGGSPGGPTAGTRGTYRDTTLPGRLLVNMPTEGEIYNLQTGQRVKLPRSAPFETDYWTAGASTSTLIRYNGSDQTDKVALFDSASLTPGNTLLISQEMFPPVLSADGRYLLTFWYNFAGGELSGDRKLTVFDAASGAVVDRGSSLDSITVLGDPAAWLPDGNYIYLAPDKKLYRSAPGNPNTELIAELTGLPDNNPPLGGPPSVQSGHLAVSPDGKQIAFSWEEKRDVNEDHNIWVANIDGTGLRRLTSPPNPADPLNFTYGSPVWSPDGKWIAGVLYMSGVVTGPAPPSTLEDPFAGWIVVGTTGCIDQVFVVPADSSAVAVSFPEIDRQLGVKVAAASGKDGEGEWVTTCSGRISWLP
jgi:hypothetical protein